MKTIHPAPFLTIFIVFCTSLIGVELRAQSGLDTLRNELWVLKRQVAAQNAAQDLRLQANIDSLNRKIDHVLARISRSDTDILATQNNLEAARKESTDKITTLDRLLGNTARNWMLGILLLAALSGWLFWWLRQRIQSGELSVQSQIMSTTKTIEETQKSLTEETVKLDTKLSEILESQLKIEQARQAAEPETSDVEADHSLALKVADEILRINKNLSNMDPGTKGLKQLAASISRIEDNFAANGYTMPVLLGKAFRQGMNLIVANSIPDENLAEGEEIITRIITPQVNYKGVMIQVAQVEVSVGQ